MIIVENMIINVIIMEKVLYSSLDWMFVDDDLSFVLESKYVSDEQNDQMHVAIKYNGSLGQPV